MGSTTSSSTSAASTAHLQLELRRLFQIAPPHVALRESLACLGRHFDGVYIAMHGCPADEPLSEEWCANGFRISDELREHVNNAMFQAMGGDAARCLRLSGRNQSDERIRDGAAIVVATMHNEELAPAGGAAMVVPCSERDAALALLSSFESIIGFVSLLASNEIDLRRVAASREQDGAAAQRLASSSAARTESEDPWRVGWDLVGELQGRYGYDQVALGFVAAGSHEVEVKVVSGMDHVRAGNPGIMRIRAAMEETLDRGSATLWPGRDRPTIENANDAPDDPRLHRQWSDSVGGDPVATIPLRIGDHRIVGVIALRHSTVEPLRLARLLALHKEVEPWGSLLPLVERAGRTVGRHVVDASRRRVRETLGVGRSRTVMSIAITLLIALMFAFVRIDDIVNVPATLLPSSPRTVSAPRDARLLELHARPGERVSAGQLLATLDLSDDALQQQQLAARRDSIAVEVEIARADGDFGALFASEARLRATDAELALVTARLADAEIRAPIDGMILEGELQPRVGDRLAIGEALFTIGGHRVTAELRIPDRDVPSADRLAEAIATFEPYAHPGLELELGVCGVPPLAEVVDQRAIYRVRADVMEDDAEFLRPGMEGLARVKLGSMSLWTACSRPLIRWLRRSTWL